jgi:hypothetical protein
MEYDDRTPSIIGSSDGKAENEKKKTVIRFLKY